MSNPRPDHDPLPCHAPDDDRQLLEVTIAAALIRRAQDLTTRMTWDSATSALVEVD